VSGRPAQHAAPVEHRQAAPTMVSRCRSIPQASRAASSRDGDHEAVRSRSAVGTEDEPTCIARGPATSAHSPKRPYADRARPRRARYRAAGRPRALLLATSVAGSSSTCVAVSYSGGAGVAHKPLCGDATPHYRTHCNGRNACVESAVPQRCEAGQAGSVREVDVRARAVSTALHGTRGGDSLVVGAREVRLVPPTRGLLLARRSAVSVTRPCIKRHRETIVGAA